MSTARQTSAVRLLSRQNLHFAAFGRDDTVSTATIIRRHRGINSSRRHLRDDAISIFISSKFGLSILLFFRLIRINIRKLMPGSRIDKYLLFMQNVSRTYSRASGITICRSLIRFGLFPCGFSPLLHLIRFWCEAEYPAYGIFTNFPDVFR